MPRISSDAPAYWKCSDCKTEFGRPQELKRHVRDSHDKPVMYGCPHCPYTTVNKSNVNRHQNTSHGMVLTPWKLYLGLAQASVPTSSPPAYPHAPYRATTTHNQRRSYPY